MSESQDNGSTAVMPGERLKLARERAGLTVDRVARELHLEINKVDAIEENRFKDLGAPVYVKGYLKSYARLLGITENEVLVGYESLDDAATVTDPIPVTLGSVPESKPLLPRWVLWVVAVLVGVAALSTLIDLHEPVVVHTSTLSKATSEPSSPLASLPQSVENNEVATTKEAAVAETAGTVAPIRLQFSFLGDSWVEVYDANDRQVMYELGTTDTRREVMATPPLRVVLGAASAVRLQVDSKPVSVPIRRAGADVAHFTVDAEGVVQ